MSTLTKDIAPVFEATIALEVLDAYTRWNYADFRRFHEVLNILATPSGVPLEWRFSYLKQLQKAAEAAISDVKEITNALGSPATIDFERQVVFLANVLSEKAATSGLSQQVREDLAFLCGHVAQVSPERRDSYFAREITQAQERAMNAIDAALDRIVSDDNRPRPAVATSEWEYWKSSGRYLYIGVIEGSEIDIAENLDRLNPCALLYGAVQGLRDELLKDPLHMGDGLKRFDRVLAAPELREAAALFVHTVDITQRGF